MTTAGNAPQELQTIAAALDFTITHMGGTNWSLVSKRTDGTWVINGDYGIAWYPAETWNDDGSEPTREDYFDVEYDFETYEVSNLAEFAAWATEYMTAPGAAESEADRNARAKSEGHADGAAAYAKDGDQPHSAVTTAAHNASTFAFTDNGSARAIYGQAYINGWYDAKLADQA